MFSKTKFKNLVKKQTKLFNDMLAGTSSLSPKGKAILDAVKVCSSHKNTILKVAGIIIDEDLAMYAGTGAFATPVLSLVKVKDNTCGHNYVLNKVYIIGANRKAYKEKQFGNNLPAYKTSYVPVTDEEIEEYVENVDIPKLVAYIIRNGAYSGLAKVLDRM